MWRRWKLPAVLIAAGMAYLLLMLFSPTTQIASDAVQVQLKTIGQAIYEYHTLTGKWPEHIDDLDRTSLGLRTRYWKPAVESGSIVIVFHDHLNDNPADNRDAVLAYHNQGTLAMMGNQWVCWGDLRTEDVPSAKLKAALNAPK